MVVNAMQEIATLIPTISNSFHSSLQFLAMAVAHWTVIAQNITDPDIVGQMQRAFNHFVQTGQVWALLIGLVIGYMLRSLTTYG